MTATEESRTALQAVIERIVREVLTELTVRGANGIADASSSPSSQLVISAKVVSLAELGKKLNGITQLVVPRGAVFTPAARDELRKRNIAVASAVGVSRPASQQSLVMGLAETNYEPASLITLLSHLKIETERLSQTGLLGAIDEMCERIVKGRRRGVLLTGQTAPALCAANRQGGVRAAIGWNVAAVVDAAMTLAPNLLVINPAGKSLFELKQIIRVFTENIQPGCPTAWRERLG